MRTCVIIPTYNECRTIGELVKKTRQQNLEVVVVDDGSTDNTPEIAKTCGATVLRSEKNLGKGASLIRGFGYALDNHFDAAITIDGDGQHCPEDIPYFISLAETEDAAMLIGNRMLQTKNMPFTRVLTNKFMSWLISQVARQNIPDTQCGFRLIKKWALEKINLKCAKFEIESEMIIKASRLGFKIKPILIKTIYSEEKSRINPIIDTIRFLRFIINHIWITPY